MVERAADQHETKVMQRSRSQYEREPGQYSIDALDMYNAQDESIPMKLCALE